MGGELILETVGNPIFCKEKAPFFFPKRTAADSVEDRAMSDEFSDAGYLGTLSGAGDLPLPINGR